MGRSASGRARTDLLTTNFSCRMLVGEKILRFYLVKDLLIEEKPAREKGMPFPLGDVAAWVRDLAVSINAGEKISVSGGIEGKAVFYSVAGPKEVGWPIEEFEQEIDFPGALPGMEAKGHGRVSFIGGERLPLEAEGKLLYQLGIEVELFLSVVDPQEFELAVGLKDISPDRVSRDIISVEELAGEDALLMTLTDELEFAEEPGYIKFMNGYIRDFSWDLGMEGITLKGELITVSYFFSGNERGFKEKKQHFSRLVEHPQLKKGSQVSFFPRVVYAVHEPAGKNVRQTASIDIFFRVTRTVQQEVITDIQGVSVKKEHLLLNRPLGTVKDSLELVHKLFIPYPQQITAGPSRLISLNVEPHDGTISVSGTLEKNIYHLPALGEEYEVYQEESEKDRLPFLSRAEENFFCTLYLPGTGADSETAAYFSYGSADFAPTENDTLQISRALLEVKAWDSIEVPVVVPYRVAPGTSFVVYAIKSGDTLLKVSRDYGVKPFAIAEANGLPEDAFLEMGQRLLIPLIFATDE